MRSPFFVLIAGGSASGKTTLARAILDQLGSQGSGFSLDNFYRDQQSIPMQERLRVNYDHPDALDFEQLLNVLENLKRGIDTEIPVYDFAQHTRSVERVETIAAREFIVVEGILALWHPRVRAQCDLSVFVDAPPEVRFERRFSRDTSERGRTAESVRAQWSSTVEPMYQQLCAPTKQFADLLLSGTEQTSSNLTSVLSALAGAANRKDGRGSK